MEEKAIAIKIEIVCDYIKRLEKTIETFEPALENNDELVDLNIEIANVFDEEIPQIKNTILLLQTASLNGHLCHIWRPACDLNGGQPRTH